MVTVAALALGLGLSVLRVAGQTTNPNTAQPATGKPAAGQAATPPTHPIIPLIRTTTTVVDIPVLVLDKQGNPIEVFGRRDFTVLDDGHPQKITGFDDQPRPVSLAIVVDTGDYNAIGQAKRSADLISQMVVGAAGRASVFIGGPEPKQILPFTSDSTKLVNTLTHLTKTPTAPQGQGSIVEPLNLAMLDLEKQPDSDTRAALVISSQSGRSGVGAEAILENSMSDAIPVFRIAPNHPAGMPNYVNPDTPEQQGTGQGSQRVIHPSSPVGAGGQPTGGSGTAGLDLRPIIGAATSLAGKLIEPHHLDFVYATGGMVYSPGNDNQFDQKLSLIGDELRAFYHLYYSPNDLTQTAQVHEVTVQLAAPATASVGQISYRRTYLGIQPH